MGTIHCCTADKSMGEFDIKHVKRPREIKELLSAMVEEERRARRVGMREYVDGEEEIEDDSHNG